MALEQSGVLRTVHWACERYSSACFNLFIPITYTPYHIIHRITNRPTHHRSQSHIHITYTHHRSQSHIGLHIIYTHHRPQSHNYTLHIYTSHVSITYTHHIYTSQVSVTYTHHIYTSEVSITYTHHIYTSQVSVTYKDYTHPYTHHIHVYMWSQSIRKPHELWERTTSGPLLIKPVLKYILSYLVFFHSVKAT